MLVARAGSAHEGTMPAIATPMAPTQAKLQKDKVSKESQIVLRCERRTQEVTWSSR